MAFKAIFSVLVIFCLVFSVGAVRNVLGYCHFNEIYQFGDSMSDVGNLIREYPVGASTNFARLPYGQTFFEEATGRCSNGLLMIDYIAMAVGLPLLPPYKHMGTWFGKGVNFAVAGSTALSSEALAAHNITNPVTNSSLGVQLDWMDSYFSSTSLDEIDRLKKLRSALFMVGETGGNDYNYAIFQRKQMEELKSMVPQVVEAVINGTKRAIEMGAVRLVVPGNFPIGCLPIYKTAFQGAPLNEQNCVTELNEFAEYHNKLLQEAILKLKQENPNIVIVYGDYYNAYQDLLRKGKERGYEVEKACCGIGGKYNFDLGRMCGGANVSLCEDVDRHLSWDGIHMTQQSYKHMAAWLIPRFFAQLACF
ncbi:acetylajmalan esterase-like [Salvia splendens]|uniref:acetylajmalan esterase-like n=1 Tax=Salvia splendens TaxID=180675 RepID=UPI001C276C29|nr:acetylajmalan esterase-like [Salvia splendens]